MLANRENIDVLLRNSEFSGTRAGQSCWISVLVVAGLWPAAQNIVCLNSAKKWRKVESDTMDSTSGSPHQPMTDCFIWLRMSEHVCVCTCASSVSGLLLFGVLFAPTSEFRGCMSNSVELCPMPFGMPAVRYMAPTPRLFLASLAAFISSTVSPSSAKVWSPALAGVPSSHSWKWRLWLTAKQRWGERREMLIRWNAYQCRWDTTEPCPDDEIISTACVYVHSCLLLPAIKKDDSLEIAARISLAFSQAVTVSSFIPRFSDITAAWAASVWRQVRFCGTPPVRRRQQDRPQSWSSTSSLTTKPFYLHSIKSLGLSRNSLKNPNVKLFAPQVLNYVSKPTEPPGLGQWLPGAD